MEIERRPPVIAKKLWNLVTILFHILKKGPTKIKILAVLHIWIKRWRTAGEAMSQIMHHLQQDYSALACSGNSTDIRMSIVPRCHDYEFSCSSSPAHPSYFSKSKRHHHHHRGHYCHYRMEEQVFDVLNRYDVVDASPLVSLPGFGHSPNVRQLRVTDSPFPVKDAEENPQVDKDAEEFIKKFYNDLNRQGRVAALEPPSPNSTWER